jgi:hypothetical protein
MTRLGTLGVARWWLAAAFAAGIGAPLDAAARALVEPGDILVSAGDTVFAVRADGGGVAPFSPRAGSGTNQLDLATGVAIDAGSSRVFVATAFGELYAVDPDDGVQTRVTTTLGGALDLGGFISALAPLADGGLLAASSTQVSSFPIPSFDSALYLVSAPTAGATAVASSFADLVDGALQPNVHGLAVGEPSLGDAQILVSTLSLFGGGLGTVDPDTRMVTPVPGIPVQSDVFVSDTALDCSAGIASLCVRYWLEGSTDGTDCVAADAAVYRSSLGGSVDVHVGSPLRCPFAIAVGSAGTLFVADAEADFTDPRVYRLDRNPTTDEYTPVLIAGEADLPDLTSPALPRIAVSAVALPEPGSAAACASSALALVAARRRRARSS